MTVAARCGWVMFKGQTLDGAGFERLRFLPLTGDPGLAAPVAADMAAEPHALTRRRSEPGRALDPPTANRRPRRSYLGTGRGADWVGSEPSSSPRLGHESARSSLAAPGWVSARAVPSKPVDLPAHSAPRQGRPCSCSVAAPAWALSFPFRWVPSTRAARGCPCLSSSCT